MLRPSTLSLLTFVAFCMFGCAANGPLFSGPTPLDPTSSEIVVYRPDKFARGGATYFVHLDDTEVARLKNAGFTSIPTSPGTHALEIRASAMQSFKPMKVLAEAKAGVRLFFRFEPSVSGSPVVLPNLIFIPVGFGLEQVPENQALIELRTLRRSE